MDALETWDGRVWLARARPCHCMPFIYLPLPRWFPAPPPCPPPAKSIPAPISAPLSVDLLVMWPVELTKQDPSQPPGKPSNRTCPCSPLHPTLQLRWLCRASRRVHCGGAHGAGPVVVHLCARGDAPAPRGAAHRQGHCHGPRPAAPDHHPRRPEARKRAAGRAA
eukprot:125329-Chlamydomonas_euryale.AAC.2